MKILCFITSRPSYSRVKTVLERFEAVSVDYGIVCIASATEELYGNVSDMISSDGFRVIRNISTQLQATTGISSSKTTALGLISSSDIIDELRPKAVISIADRYETISTAIAASYQGVPCIHIQGGEITGNIDDKVRNAVSSLSDLHFPATYQASNRLKGFVKNPGEVYNYGCPSVDLYLNSPQYTRKYTLSEIQRSSVGPSIDAERPYIVVMLHPDTNNVNSTEIFACNLLKHSLNQAASLIWFWPNSDSGSSLISKSIRKHREIFPGGNLHLVKNVDPFLFINLLRHSKGLVGNSSVGVREAGILGIPTIDIGFRQFQRERHSNVVTLPCETTGLDVFDSLSSESCQPCYTYGNGNAGLKIADHILDKYCS